MPLRMLFAARIVRDVLADVEIAGSLDAPRRLALEAAASEIESAARAAAATLGRPLEGAAYESELFASARRIVSGLDERFRPR